MDSRCTPTWAARPNPNPSPNPNPHPHPNQPLCADVGGADIAVTMTRLQETLTILEASQASFVRLANLSLFSMLR